MPDQLNVHLLLAALLAPLAGALIAGVRCSAAVSSAGERHNLSRFWVWPFRSSVHC